MRLSIIIVTTITLVGFTQALPIVPTLDHDFLLTSRVAKQLVSGPAEHQHAQYERGTTNPQHTTYLNHSPDHQHARSRICELSTPDTPTAGEGKTHEHGLTVNPHRSLPSKLSQQSESHASGTAKKGRFPLTPLNLFKRSGRKISRGDSFLELEEEKPRKSRFLSRSINPFKRRQREIVKGDSLLEWDESYPAKNRKPKVDNGGSVLSSLLPFKRPKREIVKGESFLDLDEQSNCIIQ